MGKLTKTMYDGLRNIDSSFRAWNKLPFQTQRALTKNEFVECDIFGVIKVSERGRAAIIEYVDEEVRRGLRKMKKDYMAWLHIPFVVQTRMKDRGLVEQDGVGGYRITALGELFVKGTLSLAKSQEEITALRAWNQNRYTFIEMLLRAMEKGHYPQARWQLESEFDKLSGFPDIKRRLEELVYPEKLT